MPSPQQGSHYFPSYNIMDIQIMQKLIDSGNEKWRQIADYKVF
jgi:hypothetical protein